MKVIAEVPIYAGKNAIFGPDAAEKMIGQETKDGDIILEARQTSPEIILLTIQKEIPDTFIQKMQPGDIGFR